MSDYPYPGLRPFHQDETDIFFGREEQVNELLKRLEHARFVAVIGASGCGKSSLLSAGVIAALETGFLASTGARWRVARLQPGQAPRDHFAMSLVRTLGPLGQVDIHDTYGFLRAALRRGPLGLRDVVRETGLPENTNLLVLVDQFEEIFRYRREGDSEEANAFVALLLATAERRDIPVYVVIAMRSDFLGECAVFEGLPEKVNESSFLIPRLTRDQREAAIVGPARVFKGKVEPVLLHRVLNDMGVDPDQLPLMQHALMRTWEEANRNRESSVISSHSELNSSFASRDRQHSNGPVLTLDDYEKVGGLAKALSRHADEAFNELGEEHRRIAELIFRCLTGGGIGPRDTRRPVSIHQVAQETGVTEKEVMEVVRIFHRPGRSFLIMSAAVTTNRILEPMREGVHGENTLPPDTILDISHESLIRQWERLNSWVKKETKLADDYRLLQETARRWKKDFNESKEALWRAPELDVALKWREEENPTPEWAKRYERFKGDFELAMEFLDASDQKCKDDETARQQEAEEERQRELAKARSEEKRRQEEVLRQQEIKQVQALAEEEQRRAKLAEELANEQQQRAELAEEKRREEEAARRWLRRQSRALWVLAVFVVLALIIIIKQKTQLDSKFLGDKSLSLLQLDQVDLSLLLSLEADQRADTFESRNGLMSGVLLWSESKLHDTLVLSGVPKRFMSVSMSPGGKWLASVGEDYTVILWDLKSNPPKKQILSGHKAPVYSLAFSEDGKMLASGSCGISATKQETNQVCSEGEVVLWNLTTTPPQLIGSLAGYTTPMYSLAFSPDGKALASGSADNTVTLWDIKSNPPKKQILSGHKAPVYSLAFSEDGKMLASGSCGISATKQETNQVCSEGEIVLWNLTTTPPRLVRSLVGHTAPVLSLAFNPNGEALASGGGDNTVILWNPNTWTPFPPLTGHGGPVQSLTFSRDGKMLASGSSDKKIILWDLTTDSPRGQSLTGHKTSVRSLAFASDGRSVISVSEDFTVNVWNAQHQEPAQPLTNTRQVRSLAFSEGGKMLASGSCGISATKQETNQVCSEGEVVLWNLTTTPPQLIGSLAGYTTPMYSLAFSPDGKALASGSADNTVTLWDIKSNPPKKQILSGHKAPVYSLAFSEDGKMLASGSCGISATKQETNQVCSEGEIVLWNLTTTPPRLVRSLVGHTAPVLSLAFNPNGEALASGGGDNTVILWNPNTWTPFPPLTGHGGPVQSLTFSRDGKMLASGSSDKKIILWNVSPPNPGISQVSILWDLKMPEAANGLGISQSGLSSNSGVTSLAFSPDNKFLASVSPELGIIFWGVNRGRPFALPLTTPGSNVLAATFNQDGKKLLSASTDGTGKSWDMERQYWKKQACKIASRNLTTAEWEALLEQDIGWSFYHRGCPELPHQKGEPPDTMPRRLWGRVLEGWYGFLGLL